MTWVSNFQWLSFYFQFPFGASNWNETKHILMNKKHDKFETKNGMSYINVCKERSKLLPQETTQISLLFGGFIMVATCEHRSET